MATVYVVCVAADQGFVGDLLLPDLPRRGLGHWLCARHLGTLEPAAMAQAVAQAMQGCAAVLIVISPRLAASAGGRRK